MRVILPKEDIHGQRVTISGEKAHYLMSVLRCQVGDELQILDDEGSLYKSRIASIENKKVVADIFEKSTVNTESPLNLILIQGILKGEKMDWVIQKTTELGVKEIIPAITERSQVKHTRKTERWRKIAEEASRQSGRTKIPIVYEATSFQDIFDSNPPIPPFLKRGERGLHGLIFYEEGGMKLSEAVERIKQSINSQLSTLNSQLFLAIGPEGGFKKGEVNLASSNGLIATSLGKRILRAETAAISAVTLVQFLMGDMD